jgi:hypothetical protein
MFGIKKFTLYSKKYMQMTKYNFALKSDKIIESNKINKIGKKDKISKYNARIFYYKQENK